MFGVREGKSEEGLCQVVVIGVRFGRFDGGEDFAEEGFGVGELL